MELCLAINNLKEIDEKKQKIKIYLALSYPLTLIYFGILLRKWAKAKLAVLQANKEHIEYQLRQIVERASQEAEKELADIRKQDTYLVDTKVHQVESLLDNDQRDLDWLRSNKESFDEPFNQSVSCSTDVITQIRRKVREFNKEFVARRKEEYKSLWVNAFGVTLDDNQLTAIIIDDKHNLVVAGAGSGKTEVLVTRIAYLVKRKPDNVKPERILALAYQNKSKNEIRERLLKKFGIDIKVKTFHSLGKQILEKHAKDQKKEFPRLKFAGDNYDSDRSEFVKKLYLELLRANTNLQQDIIDFMKYYSDVEISKDKTDFKTKEDYYKYMRGLRYTALNGKGVKSEAEREILNFFIMHNFDGKKIKVLYEDPAEWMNKEDLEKNYPKPDFFFPDFNLYLEHWALNKNHEVPDWFEGENPTEHYIKKMKYKKKEFDRQEKYRLVETFSWEFCEKGFIDKLQERFLKFLNAIQKEGEFEPISYEELVERVWEECRVSIDSLPGHIHRFIHTAKTYDLTPESIRRRLEEKHWSRKQRTFAKIALNVYEKYNKELLKDNAIDFEDMINQAVGALKDDKNLFGEIDHILIDEFQDINKQRYKLIKALMENNPTCKLFCIGDDWQSIMGFTGSTPEFFVHFGEYFDHYHRTDLTINYRSAKSIVDTGAQIIKHSGDSQIPKKTMANNEKIGKVKVYNLLHREEYKNEYQKQMVNHCVATVKQYIAKGYSPRDIMILARILKSPITSKLLESATASKVPIGIDDPTHEIVPFMSVHRSKGLEARVVLILNVIGDLYGFPCEKENPDIFEPAIDGRRQDREAEERRLFYVAVTRAKEEVYIYTQKCAESKFLREIKGFVETEDLVY